MGVSRCDTIYQRVFMNPTIEKIQSFATYQSGWSFGEGVQFSENTVSKGIQLAKIAHTLGFYETDAFPGLSGEVMLTVYQGNEYWEFILHPDETLTFVYEKDEETKVYEEKLPFEFAVSLLTNIAFQYHLFIPQEQAKAPVFA
jgi:hypothetical protein